MSVYTRTGDKGKTSLYAGKRVLKSDKRIEAIGSVDELNSAIGVAISEISGQEYQVSLKQIQNDLFDIGGALANPSSKLEQLTDRVAHFEKTIDKLEKELPRLENFILPGGGKLGALLHFARTIARRAERRVIDLSLENKVQDEIIVYLNRLSDLLFMFARYINFKEKRRETIWKSR